MKAPFVISVYSPSFWGVWRFFNIKVLTIVNASLIDARLPVPVSAHLKSMQKSQEQSLAASFDGTAKEPSDAGLVIIKK